MTTSFVAILSFRDYERFYVSVAVVTGAVEDPDNYIYHIGQYGGETAPRDDHI